MSSQAKSAYGTQLQIYNGTTYNTIEECTSISGPAQKGKAIDVTNMDSQGGFAEYIQGIIDGGQISVEGNWTYATNQALALTNFQAKTLTQFKLLLPGTQPAAGYWTFSGYIIDHSMDFKVTDRITWKATIQITGKPTYATV